MRTVFWAGLCVFLLDQVTKFVVVYLMDLRHLLEIDVVHGLLRFRMAWNYGINFGLFSNEGANVTRWILVGIAFAISAGVLFWVNREKPRWIGCVAAGLVIGGALGNVMDRLLYGAVADFVNMTCCGLANPYAFNVADVAIFLGAAMLVFLPAEKEA